MYYYQRLRDLREDADKTQKGNCRIIKYQSVTISEI